MLQISMPFPEGGLVYDYTLDDGGASRIGEDEEEEEKKKTKVCTLVTQPFTARLCNQLYMYSLDTGVRYSTYLTNF